MRASPVSILFTLYLLGRKIKSSVKKHNKDRVFKATILDILSNKPLTISEISQKLFTKVSATSEKITDLEASGFVKKEKGRDSRKIYLELTDKGKNEINHMRNIMNKHCTEIFTELNRQELNSLSVVLTKMINNKQNTTKM